MRSAFMNLFNGSIFTPIFSIFDRFGTSGNDNFDANPWMDRFFGGQGSDTVNYSDSYAGVVVDLLTGQGNGGTATSDRYNSIENVIGSNYDDIITGNNADNALTGLGGNDRFIGSNGEDVLTGGSGVDTVDYSNLDKGIVADLEAGNVKKGFGSDGENDTVFGIENVTGTNQTDRFIGNAADNTFVGLDGNDNFVGSTGNDSLIGGAGDYDLVDYSGNNAGINVNLQTGVVDKGGNNGQDFISGIETVIGTDFGDTMQGAGGNDVLAGFGGDDTILGGAGNDYLMSGAGNDTMDGGIGDDTLYADAGNNTLDGGEGIDTVNLAGSQGDVEVSLKDGESTNSIGEVNTIENVENVTTGAGDDTIEGSDGDNVIEARAGDDTINGLDGNDTMTGGAGADIFVFENDENFFSDDEFHGNDVITDFEAGVDKIDLSETEVNDFEDLLNYDPNDPESEWGDRYMVQEGDDVVIYTMDGAEGDSITLENVNMNELSADDFIF